MSAISFRIPKYSDSEDIEYSFLGANFLGFSSTGSNFKIRVGYYPDYTDVVSVVSQKKIDSVSNIKPTHSNSGLVQNERVDENLSLLKIPNWCSTLNISFGDPSDPTQYDISNAFITTSGLFISGEPSFGIVEESKKANSIRFWTAEICHKNPSQTEIGSGSASWSTFVYRSNEYFSLSKNPGPSGLYASVGGTGMLSNVHDWHLALTLSPLDVNSVPIMPITCIIEYI